MPKKNSNYKKVSGANSLRSKKTLISKRVKAINHQVTVKKAKKPAKKYLTPVREAVPNLHAPTELKLDILQFLDRNEIEKCQLFQRSWNFAVVNYNAQSPLRILKSMRHVPKAFKSFHQPYDTPPIGWNALAERSQILADNPLSALWPKNSIIDEVVGFADCQFEAHLRSLVGYMGEKIVSGSLKMIFYDGHIFAIQNQPYYAEQFKVLTTIWNECVSTDNLVVKWPRYVNFVHYLNFMHIQNSPSLAVLRFQNAPKTLEVLSHRLDDFLSAEFDDDADLKFYKIFENEDIELTRIKLTFCIDFQEGMRYFRNMAPLSNMLDQYLSRKDVAKTLPLNLELLVNITLMRDFWKIVINKPNFEQQPCQECDQLDPKPIWAYFPYEVRTFEKNGRAIHECYADVIFEAERRDEWKLRLVFSYEKKTINLLVVRRNSDKA